jgi:hypothetical protein
MKVRLIAVIIGTIILAVAGWLVWLAMSGTVTGIVSMLCATVASALIFTGMLFWSRALVRAGSSVGIFAGERAVALLLIVLISLGAGYLLFWR